MLSPTGERTLISAVIPPGPAHINGVHSYWLGSVRSTFLFAALCQSLVLDFFVKSTGRTNLHSMPYLFPMVPDAEGTADCLVALSARLNCLTKRYSKAWSELGLPTGYSYLHSGGGPRLPGLGATFSSWEWSKPIRSDLGRRQALVEIDVLASIALGLSLEDLTAIYRVQFPVLQQYERERLYDQNGRQIPTSSTAAGEAAVSLVKLGEILKEQVGFDLTREYLPADDETVELLAKTIKIGKKEAGVLGVSERCTMADIMVTTTVTYYDEERPEGYEVELVGIRYIDPGLEPPMERVYPTPWTRCDREEDYRVAWAEFERRLGRASDAEVQA